MSIFLKSFIAVLVAAIAALTIALFSANRKEEFRKALSGRISEIMEWTDAEMGVAVSWGDEMLVMGSSIIDNPGEVEYPLFSVFKFHLALAVLDRVDKGQLSLDREIPLKEEDLVFAEFSELKRKYPEGSPGVVLREILEDTVSYSDNNGCDILLNLLGGTSAVQSYLDRIGAKGVSVAATEGQLHISPSFFMQNKSTVTGLALLLNNFDQGGLLSPESTALLRKMMEDSPTGANRLKGLLPAGTVVAHKTGTGPRIDGVAAACNDAGVITLPDGSKMTVVVFVTGSSGTDEENERAIAEIAKAAWDALAKESRSNR